LYYNEMKDLITQQPNSDGDLVFENTDSATVRGIEAELEGRWESGLKARLSYTFADGTEEAAGIDKRWLRNSPRHLGQASVSVPLWADKIFASLEVQMMSKRATLADRTVPGFVLVNATLFSRELVKNLEASASIYNLFDQRYRDPAGPDFTQDSIEQDGRTFRVKLTYHF
jgi:iron complex outermembrane receptor protein